MDTEYQSSPWSMHYTFDQRKKSRYAKSTTESGNAQLGNLDISFMITANGGPSTVTSVPALMRHRPTHFVGFQGRESKCSAECILRNLLAISSISPR